jgi:hypothetical protein
MLGTMTVLADGGISRAVMALGGTVWRERARLGAVLATGLALRRRFAVASLFICAPLLAWMLHSHGANWIEIPALVAFVSVAFVSSLILSLAKIAPSLHQEIFAVAGVQAYQSAARLIFMLILLSLLPTAAAAILCAAATQAMGIRRLWSISSRYAEPRQREDAELRESILKVVRRSMPAVTYYCFSGQITVWLISLLGSTVAVAQVGALGRLSQIMVTVGVVYDSVIIPRIARQRQDPGLLSRRYWQIFASTSAILLCAILLARAFPTQILWLLGRQYGGLQAEVPLCLAGASLSLMRTATYGVVVARGWIPPPILAIPLDLGVQAVLLLTLNVGTVPGVLWFGILSSIPSIVVTTSVMLYKTRTLSHGVT